MRTSVNAAQLTFDLSTSSAAGSRAKTSLLRASVLASLVVEAASGTSSLASLRKCARDSLSSRTLPAEQSFGSMPSEEAWNGSAMRRYRSRLALAIAELPIAEHAFSSSGRLPAMLPTLTVKGNHNKKGLSKTSGDGLATVIGSGPLNPAWLEWFMGFPDGWTERAR